MMMDSYTLAFEGIMSFVLLGLTILLCYMYGTGTYSTWSQQGVPGPKPTPFWGNALPMLREGIFSLFTSWSKQYGKYFGVYIMRRPVLLTTDVDILKEVFIKDSNNFTDRILFVNPILTPPMSLSVGFTNGQQWRRQRHTLSPTFSASKLRMMGVFINQCCENLVQAMERSEKAGKAVDVKQKFGAYTMDVIAGTGFGFETNSLAKDDDPFLRNAAAIINASNFLTIPTLIAELFPTLGYVMTKLGFSMFPAKETGLLAETIRTVMEDRKRDQTLKTKPDLLQLMMDAELNDPDLDEKVDEKHLTTDEIIAQGILLFVAGYDTTATTLQYLSYLLTINPEKQDKLYNEIIAAVGDAEPTYDNVMNISYLDSCIRETQRLFPPVPFAERKVQQERTIKDVTLPAGSVVCANIIGLMKDEDFFPQPEKFLPERFEDEGHPIPQLVKEMMFGAGPRQCIGMRLSLYETKMAVVSVLRKFRFVKAKDTPNKIILTTRLFSMPKTPIFVAVEPRQISP